MKISPEGVRLIKSFEGYQRKLANGDCTAYQTYLGKNAFGKAKYDIPTIGYGCTVGIKMGMVWTEAQATEALMTEVSKHEDYVTQYVTVPINQNEFDALVSFCYNCGPGNLKKLVSRLNKGDHTGTAKAFLLYTKASGITLKGLIARRTRESALFQKPTVAPEEPYMAQTVSKSLEMPHKLTATVSTLAALGVQKATQTNPLDLAEGFISTGQRVQNVSEQGHGLLQWVGGGLPLSLIAAVAGCAALYFVIGHVLPKYLGSNK